MEKILKAPVLFVNACVRKESRTRRLAEKLLEKIGKPYEEILLHENLFLVADEEYFKLRDRLIAEEKFEDPIFDFARMFQEAETIVIAAPFWDLSFPAALKVFVERINVVGVTFKYSSDGTPHGLCNAKKIYYVTTAGGDYMPEEYGFGYIKALAHNFYEIPEVKLIKATGLDIVGADVEKIMKEAEESIEL